MAVLKSTLNLAALQFDSFTPSKVCQSTINPKPFSFTFKTITNKFTSLANSVEKPPISCNSMFENYNSSDFLDTHFQKLNKLDFCKLIKEYISNGSHEEAIRVYVKMLCVCHSENGFVELREGEQIRGHVWKVGLLNDLWIVNLLWSMYCECGASEKAYELFDKMPERDVLEKMIIEYTEDGLYEEAVMVYITMLKFGFPVDECSSLPCLIKAIGGLSNLKWGEQIHGHILKVGMLSEIYVSNSLLAMYWKCGSVKDAYDLFDKMPERDLISWNTMISGFNRLKKPIKSLEILRRMGELGLKPNRVTCNSALSSCTSCESLILGREIHCFSIKHGLIDDPFLANGVIDMYMKCRDFIKAGHVFKRLLLYNNTVGWNVMISGYVYNQCLLKALNLFFKMRVLSVEPDFSTIVSVLVLCSKLSNLELGQQAHCLIVAYGLQNNVRVETALLDMYCKCGDIETGLKLFESSKNRNFIMWGAIIAGCAQHGRSATALELFNKFNLEGGVADSVTVLAVLRACSSLTLKPKGMEVHGFSVKMGFDSDVFVGGALIDMYAKCRSFGSAQKVLIRLPVRDVISWNALISGYAQSHLADDALNAFRDMQFEHVRPSTVSIACILGVCAELSVFIFCKQIHGYMIRNGLESNVLVINSLIATYTKCGAIKNAWYLFNIMPVKDKISWNSMIAGLGLHGCVDDMLVLFDRMKKEGLKPDHITFTAILSACSHAGRVHEGWKHFKSMMEDYGLVPGLEQFTCMVDLFGRAGQLDRAYDLILHMPCDPDAHIWGSLLGSCKIHGNKQLAECVANHIFELDSENTGYFVLLCNIYEDFGKWDDVTRIRAAMKDMGLKKRPGCSWIEVNNKVHVFLASDRSHHQSEEIYVALEDLTAKIKEAGYNPLLHSGDWV